MEKDWLITARKNVALENLPMRRKKRKLRWRSKKANHRKKPTMG